MDKSIKKGVTQLQAQYGPLMKRFIPGHLKKQFLNSVELVEKNVGLERGQLGDHLEENLGTIIALHDGQNELPAHLKAKGYQLIKVPAKKLDEFEKANKEFMAKHLKPKAKKSIIAGIKNPFAKSVALKKPRGKKEYGPKAPATKEQCASENKLFINGKGKRRPHCRARKMPRLEKA